MCIYRYNVLSTFYVQTYIPYVYMHIVCICIYMYIYIHTSNSSDNKNPREFLLTFPSLSRRRCVMTAKWHPLQWMQLRGWSFNSWSSCRHLDFRVLHRKEIRTSCFCFENLSTFDSFLGPVLWGLQDIDSIAKIYLKKEPPPKKPGLGPYKPMYMGGNINFPRTWYGDWMMFQCVSGGSTLVCIVSFRCCSESWLHWPLNLLNTVSSGNLRVI